MLRWHNILDPVEQICTYEVSEQIVRGCFFIPGHTAPRVTFISPLEDFHTVVCFDWLMIDGLVSVVFSYEITLQWTAVSAAAERGKLVSAEANAPLPAQNRPLTEREL